MPKTFKIATYNANSLRMRLTLVLDWLKLHQPDVLAIQETKVTDKDFPLAEIEAAGWKVIYHGQKSYNGVCMISQPARSEPRNVITKLDDDSDDKQARLIAAEYDGITIINTYVPQGSEVGSEKFRYKLRWLERLQAFLQANYAPDQALAWVGDFNIAPEDIDVYAPDFYEDGVGVHPEERELLESLRRWGFVDVFRKFHADEKKQFSFFDYRVRDSVKYLKGWRIDHVWATHGMAERALSCEIDLSPRKLDKASDHTFVVAEFKD